MNKLSFFVVKLWFDKTPTGLSRLIRIFLWPFSRIYQGIIAVRRAGYKISHQFTRQSISQELKTPVMVIGNLTVGGTGKTPLLIAIAENFKRRGINVGVVSRGYKGQGPFPCVLVGLNEYSSSELLTLKVREAGDEPVLIALKTGVPISVHPNRPKAIQALLDQAVLSQAPLDLILSDDGLQHYAMDRQVEVVVVDGERGFGNGLCLPAGPLREPLQRLKTLDFIVVNGCLSSLPWQERQIFSSEAPKNQRGGDRIFDLLNLPSLKFLRPKSLEISVSPEGRERSNHCSSLESRLFEMRVTPAFFTQLKTGEKLTPLEFEARLNAEQRIHEIHAVCGLGNPDRFFKTLRESLSVGSRHSMILHPFPDHHEYIPQDFDFFHQNPLNRSLIICSEKDAIKCLDFRAELKESMWFLSIRIEISEDFFEALKTSITQ